MTKGSIAICFPRVEPRVRRDNTVLVVGDERVRYLAGAAGRRPRWAVTPLHPGHATRLGGRHGLVVDAAVLDDVREAHHHMPRWTQRVGIMLEGRLSGGRR